MTNAQSQRGRPFERILKEYHTWLQRLGLADVRRVPIPMQILRRINWTDGGVWKALTRLLGANFKGKALVIARLEPRSGVDFQGTLKGGRAVYIEAKTSSGKIRRAALREAEWNSE